MEKENKTTMKTDIALIKQDVKYIRKEVEGNGRKGLIEKVEDLETDNDKFKGGFSVIKWMFTFVGLSQILILIERFFLK